MSDLQKPDLLRTMLIGMLDHLQKWIFPFLKMHKQLDKYNTDWISVPAYHNITPSNKSNEDICQWNGKEMKGMSWSLLGVVTESLQGGSPAQCPIYNCAIEFIRALL
jgi:hypothetical protein